MTEVLYSDEVINTYVNFKEKTSNHKFIFSYRGKISHSIVKNLLSMAEKKIDSLNEQASVKRKIFGVMVNCLQTICAEDKHTENNEESIFLISKSEKEFTVFTGRYFNEIIAKKLTDVIEKINLLSRDSLIDLHKEKLIELDTLKEEYNIDETILSLIDISKKSNRGINYLVKPISENNYFFSIQVKID